MKPDEHNSGAYRLFIQLEQAVNLDIGRLGTHCFQPGIYVYVGSAKRGLHQRVARHARLAGDKQGNCHWHIDRLLLHPETTLVITEMHPDTDECRLSRELSVEEGVTVPVAGFGATDCKQGCKAHLYLLQDEADSL